MYPYWITTAIPCAYVELLSSQCSVRASCINRNLNDVIWTNKDWRGVICKVILQPANTDKVIWN